MGGRYKVAKEGNWKYRIVDTQSRIKLGFGEVGQEVMLVTYSNVVAEICEAALNANVKKITAHNSPMVFADANADDRTSP
jgi:hypothetical protein